MGIGATGSSREQLIDALATAMGAGSYSDTKYEGAHYDKDTGTLYCNGYIVSKNTINEALDYFKASKINCDKMAESGANASMRNIALYMQTAIEAIRMMQNAREVVKK